MKTKKIPNKNLLIKSESNFQLPKIQSYTLTDKNKMIYKINIYKLQYVPK